MGIADLTPLLKDAAPNCFVETPAVNLNNYRMAFDAYNWIFTVLGKSVKNVAKNVKDPLGKIDVDTVFIEVLKSFLSMNIKIMNYKITPVWIWDSDNYSTPAKKDTKQKRREERKKRTEKREKLRETLESMNILERPTELLEEYRRLQGDTFYFPKEKIVELKDLASRIGIPSITADGEGEYLAACMGVERIVACVYSGDTDTLAIGAPFVTKNLSKHGNELYIEGIFTPSILKTLDFDYNQFRELCILLGCDFNSRVKKVGKVGSLNLMKKHKCIYKVIEELENDGKDTSSLNVEQCKELLTPQPSGYFDRTDELNIRSEEYDADLDKYNIEYLFNIFFSRSRNFKPAINVPKC